MAFSAKTYWDSVEPPTFETKDGVTHIGKLVPFNRFAVLMKDIAKLESTDLDPEQHFEVLSDVVGKLCRLIGFNKTIEKEILELPIDGITQCITDFLVSLQGGKKKN